MTKCEEDATVTKLWSILSKGWHPHWLTAYYKECSGQTMELKRRRTLRIQPLNHQWNIQIAWDTQDAPLFCSSFSETRKMYTVNSLFCYALSLLFLSFFRNKPFTALLTCALDSRWLQFNSIWPWKRGCKRNCNIFSISQTIVSFQFLTSCGMTWNCLVYTEMYQVI